VARFKTEVSKISKPCQISGRSARVRIDWTLYSGPRLADGSVEHSGFGRGVFLCETMTRLVFVVVSSSIVLTLCIEADIVFEVVIGN
jgi:hypothetical protein